MDPLLLILFALLLIFASAILSYHSRKARERSGIPEGKLIQADSELVKFRKPLFSERLMLAGRPDAVIMKGGECIPVEIKIREPPEKPFESHIMQLAAYCFLLEENGYKVNRGLILYKGKSGQREFWIDYSDGLKAYLIMTVYNIRNLKSLPPRIRSRKCEFCSVREKCEELETEKAGR